MPRSPARATPLVLALAALAGPARADDGSGAPRTPDDLFGLGKKRSEDRPPPTCADAVSLPCPTDPTGARDTPPAALTTRLSRARLDRLPLADADLDVAATLVVGAGRDDPGPFFAGATGLENRWLLDGAPIESPRYGSLTTRVPLAFVDEVVVTTGGFSARDPAVNGALIDARLREGGAATRVEGRAWLGAGLAPRGFDRVRGEYRPYQGRIDDLRVASATIVADGPLAELAGLRLWWAAGVAPRLDDDGLVRDTFRLVDADGDGAPDHTADGRIVHESLGTIERDALGSSVPVLARIGARGTNQELAATALVSAGREARWTITAEDSAAGVTRALTGADLIASWRGRWGATGARAQASWHREARDERARTGPDAAQIGLAYVPPPDPAINGGDARVRALCLDGDPSDAYPAIPNCPLATGYHYTGGVGRTFDVVTDRPRVSAEVTHRAGGHALALGASGEDARLVVRQRFSGGFLRSQLGPGAYVDYRLVELGAGPRYDDVCGEGIACAWLDEHERTIRTRHLAAWLTDTWRPAPGLALEYGVRGERGQLGESLVVRDLLPRVGAAWDFLGKGRSRAYAGWGRYGALVPTGMGEWVFGGPSIFQEINFGGMTSTGLSASADRAIDPDARGVRTDEALAGVEVGAADVARLGLGARYRHLGRTLEDDQGVVATGGARSGVAATRDLTELHVTFENAPSARVAVRAAYAWSRLRGNWAGPWDPFEGYTLYGSALFDADPANRTGPLPGDQPHRFFAEVAGRGALWGFAIDASVRALASSGRARSVRAGGASGAFLLPRGADGRLPTVAQTNLHLAARTGAVTITLDVFNLFDRRVVTAVDEVYTPDETRPVEGGAAEDLVFLKDGAFESDAARVNRRFGQATRYQAPLAAYLGVRVDL